MPMGVVSDDQFEAELKNSSVDKSISNDSILIEPNKVITGEVIDLPTKGRGKGNVEVPDSLRKIIGETSELEGRKQALSFAAAMGLKPSSVSAYAAGATSTATIDKPSPTLTKHLSERKSYVAGKALTRLTRSLNILTTDKIQTASAREAAGIAKDMAAIVKLMEPENLPGSGDKNAPQFIVYAPTFKDERHYETIVAKDNF